LLDGHATQLFASNDDGKFALEAKTPDASGLLRDWRAWGIVSDNQEHLEDCVSRACPEFNASAFTLALMVSPCQ